MAAFFLNLYFVLPALSTTGDSIKIDEGWNRQRFDITVNGIYAFMETNLRFESVNGMLGARINFKDHLGLPDSKVMPKNEIILTKK